MAIGQVKAFSTYEMERILIKNGFECVRHNGDHRVWKKNEEMIILNRHMNKMVNRRILKEHKLIF